MCICEYFNLGTTITFKESNYAVKEDDGVFNVIVQKFGDTTESLTVFIRTRANNPTSATRMYIVMTNCILVITIQCNCYFSWHRLCEYSRDGYF